MNFKIATLILLIIVVFLGWLHFRPTPNTKPLKNKIDSLETLTYSQKTEINLMKAELELKDANSGKFENIADSLQTILESRPHTCEQENVNLKKQNTALRTELKNCKEVKSIQTKTIKKYDGLVSNYEIKEMNIKKLHSIEVKECKKNGFKMFGIGFGAGFVSGWIARSFTGSN